MISLLNIATVAIGGGLGASLRFLINYSITSRFPQIYFPLATFCINVLGCFCIGAIGGLSSRWGFPDTIRLFLATGILGGFTTFSSFGIETITLIRGGHITEAFLYVFGSVLCGCAAVFVALLMTEPHITP